MHPTIMISLAEAFELIGVSRNRLSRWTRKKLVVGARKFGGRGV